VSDLLSIGVTGVRHYLETIYSKCSLRSLSHWLEATTISCRRRNDPIDISMLKTWILIEVSR
jgi:hypothetical protein